MSAILNAVVLLGMLFGGATDTIPVIDEGCTATPYYLWNTYYTPGWISNDTWFTQTPQHTIGKAMWYAPGIMQSTALWRDMDTRGFAGGVSVISPGNIGRVAWLKRPDLSWEGPFLVVDSSQRNHAYSHTVHQGEHVEVDFDTALRWELVSLNPSEKYGYQVNEWVSSYDVEVWFGAEPPHWNPVPIRMSEWFEENATFCDEEKNRRWKLEGWEILNFAEYEEVVARIPKAVPFKKEYLTDSMVELSRTTKTIQSGWSSPIKKDNSIMAILKDFHDKLDFIIENIKTILNKLDEIDEKLENGGTLPPYEPPVPVEDFIEGTVVPYNPTKDQVPLLVIDHLNRKKRPVWGIYKRTDGRRVTPKKGKVLLLEPEITKGNGGDHGYLLKREQIVDGVNLKNTGDVYIAQRHVRI